MLCSATHRTGTVNLSGGRMERITRRAFTAVAAAGAFSGVLTASHAAAVGNSRSGGGRHHDPGEMRAMWIATVENIDWPSMPGLDQAILKRQLRTYLDAAVERKLNTVILQVRPTADALWPSPHEPWSKVLTGTQGKDPGWDPLDFAVREAHERGLKLQAWFNPYRISNSDDPEELIPEHPARRNPSWAVPYGGKLYYNPGLPEVREFVLDAMLDAVERYDIDGVHWDDYFYPYPVEGETFDDDDTFAEHGGDFDNKADWRRHNIDLLVQGMWKRLQKRKKRLPFGVSPFGVWRNKESDPEGSDTAAGVQTYDDLFADSRKWVREGWVDNIVPQLYWHMGFKDADYSKLIPWWSEAVRGTGVDLYVGEALYKVADPEQPAEWHDPAEVSRHLAFCDDYPEVKGHIFYSGKHVVGDPIGAMSQVVADHYR